MYRLNLVNLGQVLSTKGTWYFEGMVGFWIFDNEYDYGANIPCGMCEKFDECKAFVLEDWVDEPDFDSIDLDDIFDHVIESDAISKMYISDKPGIKFCLKDENRVCHEECYADDEFCEMVVFLGYPEEKIKYPNAYPIYL